MTKPGGNRVTELPPAHPPPQTVHIKRLAGQTETGHGVRCADAAQQFEWEH